MQSTPTVALVGWLSACSGTPSETDAQDAATSAGATQASDDGLWTTTGVATSESTSSSGDDDGGTTTSGTSGGSTSDPDASTSAASSSSDGGGQTDASGANAPPEILSLTVSPGILSGAGSVLIVAIATDPDGIDDLIGGTVASADGFVYGELSATADEGAYSLQLSWGDLNAAEAIDIDTDDVIAREFEVTFFDQSGASTVATVALDLESAGSGLAVCAGTSVSLASTGNCGACGFSCLDDLGSQFVGGVCYDGLDCEKYGSTYVYDADTTCDEACAVAAGPQAASSGTQGCQIHSAGGDCPDPVPNQLGNCPSLTVNTLPLLGCTPDETTFLSCSCYGVYVP